MKNILRIIGVLLILLAATYAAAPWWISLVVARQLPADFQIETMVSGHPGVSGITIESMRVGGPAPAGRIELLASDIRVNYRGLTGHVGTVELSIWPQTDSISNEGFTLDELSLPVIDITQAVPEFSVGQLRLILHLDDASPVVLDFHDLKSDTAVDGGFTANAGLSMQGLSGLEGHAEVRSSEVALSAQVQFNAGQVKDPWLVISLEQDRHAETRTLLKARFDSSLTDGDWLDDLVRSATGGHLQHLSGQVEAQARFVGKDTQEIESLLLSTPSLKLQTSDGTFDINAAAQLDREQGRVIAKAPGLARISYRSTDASGLLPGLIPGWQYGDLVKESIDLHLDEVRMEVESTASLETATASGSIAIDLQQSSPFTYTADDVEVSADTLSISTNGDFSLENTVLSFGESAALDLQMENLRASKSPGQGEMTLGVENYAMNGSLDYEISLQDEAVPAQFLFDGQIGLNRLVISLGDEDSLVDTTVVADELSIATGLSSLEDKLVSTGSGTFTNARISPLDASAGVVDISWQALDLDKLVGKLSSKTHGLSVEMESETWSGFDLDTRYELLANKLLEGSGAIVFPQGLSLPVNFEADLQSERWDITMPASTIDIGQLDSLLVAANIEIPASVAWDAGQLVIGGDIVVDETINADLVFEGKDIGVSLAGSNARQINFELRAVHDDALSVSGPLSIEQVMLAGDVNILQLKTEIKLASMDRVGLQNLHAQLFGGELALHQLLFSQDGIEDTSIELKEIDLGHLLEFANVDGLDGTGMLNMTIPIGSSQAGYYIQDGVFAASGPGRLTYAQQGGAVGNIGLQALENFQYESLDGSVNYQPDGNYQLVVHLNGRNPDLYEGYPIKFTLNIGGTLPELFETLFITGNFEEAILREIRTK